jgi:hypothetical protein
MCVMQQAGVRDRCGSRWALQARVSSTMWIQVERIEQTNANDVRRGVDSVTKKQSHVMTDAKTYQHLRLRRVKSAPALYRAMRPTLPLHLSCRRRSHACAAPYSLHKSPPQRRWPHRIPGWKTCQTCDAGARRTVKVGASCPPRVQLRGAAWEVFSQIPARGRSRCNST